MKELTPEILQEFAERIKTQERSECRSQNATQRMARYYRFTDRMP